MAHGLSRRPKTASTASSVQRIKRSIKVRKSYKAGNGLGVLVSQRTSSIVEDLMNFTPHWHHRYSSAIEYALPVPGQPTHATSRRQSYFMCLTKGGRVLSCFHALPTCLAFMELFSRNAKPDCPRKGNSAESCRAAYHPA